MYEPLAMASVPKTEDTFTAAHASKVSAQAQAQEKERLRDMLAPFLARYEQAVAEASRAGLTAVDVPCSGLSPDRRLALVRELQARGFAVHDVTTGFAIGWQPVPTSRPPAYRNDSRRATDVPIHPFERLNGPAPSPHPGADLLRETPEEVG